MSLQSDNPYELCVIGGGFWGTSVALQAHEKGYNLLHLDCCLQTAASRGAAGMVQLSWYTQETIRRRWPEDWTWQDLENSLAWLEKVAGLERTGEDFINYARPTVRKYRDDLYCIKDNDTLLSLVNPTYAEVQRLFWNEDHWIIWCRGISFTANHVVLCAGYRTDAILMESGLPTIGVRPLLGQAVVITAPELNIARPLTYLARPYVHYTVRPWGKAFRCGDTTEQESNKTDRGQELLHELKTLVDVPYTINQWIGGIRPVTETFTVKKIGPNLVAAVGGHRVGLGLAGLVGKKVLGLL